MKAVFRKIMNRLPFFWQMFISIVLLAAVLLGIHFVSTRIYENKLKEAYFKQAQGSLELACDSTFQNIRMATAIPSAVEGTQAYDYVRVISGGSLPRKYVSVLPMISKALKNQFYLRGNSQDSFLFLSGSNCMLDGEKVFPVADDCLKEYLCYRDLTPEYVLELLRKKYTSFFVPVQDITLNKVPMRALTMISNPTGSNITLLTLYEETDLLERLGYFGMPEGSILTITGRDGTVLLNTGEKSGSESYHVLEYEDKYFYTAIKVAIPESYFYMMVKSASRKGFVLTALMAVLSILIGLQISGIGSRPIRHIVDTYIPNESEHKRNELADIDRLISQKTGEVSELEKQLSKNILLRAFSGSVLTQQEIDTLQKVIVKGPWRLVAVSCRDNDACIDYDTFAAYSDALSFCTIDYATVGLIISDTEQDIRKLYGFLESENMKQRIECGVSAQLRNLADIHIGVRQAYLAQSPAAVITIYNNDVPNTNRLTWNQYELLYKALLRNDEDVVRNMLNQLYNSKMTDYEAKETFYCVCLSVYSVADELDVPFPEEERLQYDSAISPRGNFQQIYSLVDGILEKIKRKKEDMQSRKNEEIFHFIRDNCNEYEMCAQMVSQKFSINEKAVYKIIRDEKNMSFGEYLLSQRMIKAAALLSSTDEDVMNIAEKCGYQVPSTFYRAFRKYYKKTPAQYRIDFTGPVS